MSLLTAKLIIAQNGELKVRLKITPNYSYTLARQYSS